MNAVPALLVWHAYYAEKTPATTIEMVVAVAFGGGFCAWIAYAFIKNTFFENT